MSNVAGSLQKVVIAGVTYDAVGEADAQRASGVSRENKPTSGDAIQILLKQSPNIEGVTLSLTAGQYDDLEAISKGVDDVSMTIVYPNGDSLKADGNINLDTQSSANGTADVTLMPSGVDGWVKF